MSETNKDQLKPEGSGVITDPNPSGSKDGSNGENHDNSTKETGKISLDVVKIPVVKGNVKAGHGRRIETINDKFVALVDNNLDTFNTAVNQAREDRIFAANALVNKVTFEKRYQAEGNFAVASRDQAADFIAAAPTPGANNVIGLGQMQNGYLYRPSVISPYYNFNITGYLPSNVTQDTNLAEVTNIQPGDHRYNITVGRLGLQPVMFEFTHTGANPTEIRRFTRTPIYNNVNAHLIHNLDCYPVGNAAFLDSLNKIAASARKNYGTGDKTKLAILLDNPALLTSAIVPAIELATLVHLVLSSISDAYEFQSILYKKLGFVDSRASLLISLNNRQRAVLSHNVSSLKALFDEVPVNKEVLQAWNSVKKASVLNGELTLDNYKNTLVTPVYNIMSSFSTNVANLTTVQYRNTITDPTTSLYLGSLVSDWIGQLAIANNKNYQGVTLQAHLSATRFTEFMGLIVEDLLRPNSVLVRRVLEYLRVLTHYFSILKDMNMFEGTIFEWAKELKVTDFKTMSSKEDLATFEPALHSLTSGLPGYPVFEREVNSGVIANWDHNHLGYFNAVLPAGSEHLKGSLVLRALFRNNNGSSLGFLPRTSYLLPYVQVSKRVAIPSAAANRTFNFPGALDLDTILAPTMIEFSHPAVEGRYALVFDQGGINLDNNGASVVNHYYTSAVVNTANHFHFATVIRANVYHEYLKNNFMLHRVPGQGANHGIIQPDLYNFVDFVPVDSYQFIYVNDDLENITLPDIIGRS